MDAFEPRRDRHLTRLGGGSTGRARARAALLLLLGLPGQVFFYQGEELGLEEVNVPLDRRQDPDQRRPANSSIEASRSARN